MSARTMRRSCRSPYGLWLRSLGFIGVCLAGTAISPASAQSTPKDEERLILVVGAPGTTEYKEQFDEDAQAWLRLAELRAMKLIHVCEQSVSAETNNKQQVQKAIESSAGTSQAALWIVLIGHGTSDKKSHKFNLVGPDMTSSELNEWLKAHDRPVIVVNCSSTSAPFLPELSGPRRVVVTATKSSSETNYTRFGSQLAKSILDIATDIDHDEEVSLLEAFLAASAKTEKFYREQNRLATEHAILDDNGDRLGTGSEFFKGTRPSKAAQAGKKLDGELAGRVMLYSSPTIPKLSPEQLELRQRIEEQIRELRNQKSNLPEAEYWDRLEKLLLELAAI